jgi:hypothetical protein
LVARAKCHNKSNEFAFRLIVGFIHKFQSQLQQALVDLSLSNAFSIAKPSDEANLVDRIFETSNVFNHQRLIVTFVKPNANIPLSNSEAEMHKAELDSREQQPNDRINITQPIFQ